VLQSAGVDDDRLPLHDLLGRRAHSESFTFLSQCAKSESDFARSSLRVCLSLSRPFTMHIMELARAPLLKINAQV
jgi:hypothetical protein